MRVQILFQPQSLAAFLRQHLSRETGSGDTWTCRLLTWPLLLPDRKEWEFQALITLHCCPLGYETELYLATAPNYGK